MNDLFINPPSRFSPWPVSCCFGEQKAKAPGYCPVLWANPCMCRCQTADWWGKLWVHCQLWNIKTSSKQNKQFLFFLFFISPQWQHARAIFTETDIDASLQDNQENVRVAHPVHAGSPVHKRDEMWTPNNLTEALLLSWLHLFFFLLMNSIV